MRRKSQVEAQSTTLEAVEYCLILCYDCSAERAKELTKQHFVLIEQCIQLGMPSYRTADFIAEEENLEWCVL